MSYTCKFCGREFKSEDDLIKHLREEHRDEVKLRKLEHPKRVLNSINEE
jgi:DNA-directed RNA polymerase subunit RPC12/RpoP